MKNDMNTNKNLKEKCMKFVSNNSQQVCLVAAMLILGTFFTIVTQYFLTKSNFLNIVLSICVPGVIVCGLTVAMLMGSFDLSQYALMGLSGVLLGKMLEAGWNVFLAMIVVLLFSALVSVINAVLVAVVGITPMIATIGTQLMMTAASGLLTSGKTIVVHNDVMKTIGFGKIMGIPMEIYILLIVILITWYILKYTIFGRRVYACGGNPIAAELSGISVKKMTFWGFIFSGVSAGIAAIMNVAQVAAASPSAGSANSMDGITGVFLGGIAMGGGKGSVLGSVLGVLFLQEFSNGMVLLGVSSYWQKFIKGFVLLLSVSIDIMRTKYANRVVKIKR